MGRLLERLKEMYKMLAGSFGEFVRHQREETSGSLMCMMVFRPFRAWWFLVFNTQGVALGWVMPPFQGLNACDV